MPRRFQRSESEWDQEIIASWELHDRDISTERLFAMVEDDTGAGCERQIEALERAGIHPISTRDH